MIVATLQPSTFGRGHDADPPDVMRGTDRNGDHGGVTDREAGTERTGESDAQRARATTQTPDFRFPQMADARLDPDFQPTSVDYLYVSFTDATAFSPTDTMPLSRWAKALMTSQALVSLVVVGLVAARAVNILPGD